MLVAMPFSMAQTDLALPLIASDLAVQDAGCNYRSTPISGKGLDDVGTKRFGCVLGGYCIDKAIGAPFEASDFAKPGNDAQPPVMGLLVAAGKRTGLEHKVVCRRRTGRFQCAERFLGNDSQVIAFFFTNFLVPALMRSWNDRKTVWESRSKWTKGNEVFRAK